MKSILRSLLRGVFIVGTITAASAEVEHEYKGVKTDDKLASSAKSLDVKISTDWKELRVYTKRLMGLNYDWLSENNNIKAYFVNGADSYPLIDSSYLELLKGAKLPLNRMAGSESQAMQWKKAVGKYSDRAPQKLTPWATPMPLATGPVEWIKALKAIDSSSEIVWVLNMTTDTPEDARNLAEFLTGSKDTEGGRKRIEYGLPEPIKPAIWELGNELDWGGHKRTADEYVKQCKETMAAIRSVQPDAVFAALAETAPFSSAQKFWPSWHKTVIDALAPDIQYVVFHPYYHGLKPSELMPYIDTIRKEIQNSKNPDIKFYFSEHAKWPPNREKGEKEWAKYWYKTHSLSGCLDTAEWIIMIINRPDVTAMTYHAFSSGPWGMVYRDKANGKLYTTGIYEMFKIFNKIPDQSTVIDLKVEGDFSNYKSKELSFTAAAVENAKEGKVYLLFDNRLPDTERKISFNWGERKFVPEKIYSLSGSSGELYNTAADSPLRIEEKDARNLNPSSFVVPPQTFMMIVLKKENASAIGRLLGVF